jgi:hypothetical protein
MKSARGIPIFVLFRVMPGFVRRNFRNCGAASGRLGEIPEGRHAFFEAPGLEQRRPQISQRIAVIGRDRQALR